jgi:hypothetical protein
MLDEPSRTVGTDEVEAVMSKRARKRRDRRNNKANHGRKPNT